MNKRHILYGIFFIVLLVTAILYSIYTAKAEAIRNEVPSNEWISLGEYRITHYCPGSCCNGVWAGKTSTGVTPTVGRTAAVNPAVIPYGSEVMIDGHVYVAEDTGGLIRRRTDRVDILVASHDEAVRLGIKRGEIYIKK